MGSPHAHPPTPASLQKYGPSSFYKEHCSVYPPAHLMKGKRKTNPQTEAKGPHACHCFRWWIFPLRPNAEEPANPEEKSGWGLGSCSQGWVWTGWGWAAQDQPNAIRLFCSNPEKCQSPAGVKDPKTQF